MHQSAHECGIKDIPRRLHKRNRVAQEVLADGDRLFVRHLPLPTGEGYGFMIPGHDKLEDQSANSESINNPGGYACDVLFDTKRGQHYYTYQIACLNVLDVRLLELPNENTIRKDRQGNIIKHADLYTFEPVHDPTECMYPHCIIAAQKDSVRGKDISKGMKTIIRMKFAELAEKNRLEMMSRRSFEFAEWKKEIERLNNPKWWHSIADWFWDHLPSRLKSKFEKLLSAW